jgi:hypothetical protein
MFDLTQMVRKLRMLEARRLAIQIVFAKLA